MKTKLNLKFNILTGLYLIFAVVGYAQSNDSLNYYLSIAEKNNPVVMQRYHEYQAALEKIPQVKTLPDPQLEMGFYITPMELLEGRQVADIKFMQMFPWFGVIKNAENEMQQMAKAKYEEFVDARLQVYQDVQLAWFDLYRIRQKMDVTKKNLDLLKTVERLAITKLKSGSGISSGVSLNSGMQDRAQTSNSTSSGGMNNMTGNSKPSAASVVSSGSGSMSSAPMSQAGSAMTDVFRIQMSINELNNSANLLKNEEQIAVSKFNRLLNRDLGLKISDIADLKTDTLDFSYLSVDDASFSRQPMLAMIKYEQESLEARKKMQEKMGLPMVGLGLNYSIINKSTMSTSEMNGNDMIMPMLTVSVPVYRKKYKAMQRESDFLRKASENNYQTKLNDIRIEYAEALLQYHDAQRRISLYKTQLALTKKTFDIFLKSFSVSELNLTELIQVQQQIIEYDFKGIEAIVDLNKSISQIKRLKQ